MIICLVYLANLIFIICRKNVNGWPDGAPCLRSAFQNIDPSEAVEHRGGLQLSNPPYTIDVKEKCYWLHQPIELTLRGNTTDVRFRGFVIQPIVYKGNDQGTRIGEFVRLDDNGSWQQQCFRFKDSVTHSHNEKKRKMKLWWKNIKDETHYVQFVATVVKSQQEFWVKSIVSVPIPPCRLERYGVTNFSPASITPPPHVNQFKWDSLAILSSSDTIIETIQSNITDRSFDQVSPKPQRFQDAFRTTEPAKFIPRSSQNRSVGITRLRGRLNGRRSGRIKTNLPTRSTQLGNPEIGTNTVQNGGISIQQNLVPQKQSPRIVDGLDLPQGKIRRPLPQPGRQDKISVPPRAAQNPFMVQFSHQQSDPQFSFPTISNGCFDSDTSGFCISWFHLCLTDQYVMQSCRRTCGLC